MYSLDDFIAVISEFIVFFDNLAATENQKLNAALNHDVVLIEECMKKEQAEVLRFRGLDKKRTDIQNALQFKDMRLMDILPLIDSSRSLECSLLFGQLNESLKIYRSTFETAKSAIETNLYRINRALAEAGKKSSSSPQVYSPAGQTGNSFASGHFTSRQV